MPPELLPRQPAPLQVLLHRRPARLLRYRARGEHLVRGAPEERDAAVDERGFGFFARFFC
jgi:hypothetical protein